MSRYASDKYGDNNIQQNRDPEQTVCTIMDNISKGIVDYNYAYQWAKYYRSQYMTREAQLLEDHIRCQRAVQEPDNRSVCYRCDRPGHFVRDCPNFTGIRRPRNQSLERKGSTSSSTISGSFGGGGSACYRCNGLGHFARECRQYTGERRDRSSNGSGGGPMRRVSGQPAGTSECYRCENIGHFARECPEYTGIPYSKAYRGPSSSAGKRRGGGTSKCLKCNKYGHFARECREEENLCYKCHEAGHIAKECSKADLCYVCNKEGHLAKECPDGNKKTCYRCNGKGHIAPDCPTSQRVIDKFKKKKLAMERSREQSVKKLQ